MLVMEGRVCQDEDEMIHAAPPLDARELPSVLMTQVEDWIASASGWRFVGRVRLSQSQVWVGHLVWMNRRKA